MPACPPEPSRNKECAEDFVTAGVPRDNSEWHRCGRAMKSPQQSSASSPLHGAVCSEGDLGGSSLVLLQDFLWG